MKHAIARLSAAVTARTSLTVLSAAAFALVVLAAIPKMYFG
jgi:hypothetical protein